MRDVRERAMVVGVVVVVMVTVVVMMVTVTVIMVAVVVAVMVMADRLAGRSHIHVNGRDARSQHARRMHLVADPKLTQGRAQVIDRQTRVEQEIGRAHV